MGLDCSLYIMPPGKLTRCVPLDRYSYFLDVLPHLDGCRPVPAWRMLSAIYCGQSLLRSSGSLRRHWLFKAGAAVKRAQQRWGDDIPCVLLDENYDPPSRPEVAHIERRLASLRQAKQQRLHAEQFERDLAVCAQVKRELQEKIARQWE